MNTCFLIPAPGQVDIASLALYLSDFLAGAISGDGEPVTVFWGGLSCETIPADDLDRLRGAIAERGWRLVEHGVASGRRDGGFRDVWESAL